MNSLTPVIQPKGKVDKFDNDIPFLASQAAFELDDLIRGKITKDELISVRGLAEVLKQCFPSASAQHSGKRFIHPAAAPLVGQALEDSKICENAVKSVEQLVNSAWEVAERLESPDPKSDIPYAKRLRTFCVVLSDRTAAYFRAFDLFRPTHPFRK